MTNAIRPLLMVLMVVASAQARADGEPATQAQDSSAASESPPPSQTGGSDLRDLRLVGSGRDEPSGRRVAGSDATAMTTLEMAREADEIQFGFRPM